MCVCVCPWCVTHFILIFKSLSQSQVYCSHFSFGTNGQCDNPTTGLFEYKKVLFSHSPNDCFFFLLILPTCLDVQIKKCGLPVARQRWMLHLWSDRWYEFWITYHLCFLNDHRLGHSEVVAGPHVALGPAIWVGPSSEWIIHTTCLWTGHIFRKWFVKMSQSKRKSWYKVLLHIEVTFTNNVNFYNEAQWLGIQVSIFVIE